MMANPALFTLIPPAARLKPGEEQIFVAVSSTPPASGGSVVLNPANLVWNLSPEIGKIGLNGEYYAPEQVFEELSLKVTAIDQTSGGFAEGTVTLTAPSWRGAGVTGLGAYILLAFSSVFLLVGLWPLESLNLETTKTARVEAESALIQRTSELKDAVAAEVRPGLNPSLKTNGGKTARSNPASPAPASPPVSDAQAALSKHLGTSVDSAETAVKKAKEEEETAKSPTVQTKFTPKISRELDLLLLVLLAGMLGAFLHLAQSYSDFAGNCTLKESWLWWYVLRPFIGAGLALVFYATVRGGLISIVPASNTTTASLNTYGLVALCALVGLFSKAATSKLGEVFETLFKTDAASKMKDKVSNGTQPLATTVGGSSGSAKP